jgi:hypothetical protein
MIRKQTAIALVSISIAAFSCNSNADEQKEKAEAKTVTNEVSKETESTQTTGNSDVQQAAIGYCDCFNQNFKNIDPKIKTIFTNAAESNDPLLFLQKELMSINDPKEQQRIGTEMQKLSDAGEMESCARKLEEKYKIDENDKATQKQMLNALKDKEGCEFVAALMKIGIYQSEKSITSPSAQ